MKSCPVCDFLMGDDELLCSVCSEQLEASGAMAEPERDRFDLDPAGSATVATGTGGVAPAPAATATAATATAVLERAAPPAPLSDTVQFRSRDGARRAVRAAAVLAALGAGLGALVVFGARGDGPLAEPLVSWGLVAPPVVQVPEQWVQQRSDAGAFTVSVPPGAEPLDRSDDETAPGSMLLSGYSAKLGEQGALMVMATDFGRGPDAMRAADNDADFAGLIDGFVALFGLGEPTVVRMVPVGDGRAADAVFVDAAADSTARARFHLGNGRFHALVTTGPDSGARPLDEAHQRLVSSFEMHR